MKNEGALKMRFLRHGGIYRSDVSLLLVNLGRGAASRSGSGQAIGRAGKNTPSPSSAMSSGRLFLDRVARQHCPSPLHRHHQNKALDGSKGTIYHRTVNSVLTVCLTPGAHPTRPSSDWRWSKYSGLSLATEGHPLKCLPAVPILRHRISMQLHPSAQAFTLSRVRHPFPAFRIEMETLARSVHLGSPSGRCEYRSEP